MPTIDFGFFEKIISYFKPKPTQEHQTIQPTEIRPVVGQPTTFEQAVDLIASEINPTTVEDPFFHLTGGMSIRNGLGLWDRESALSQNMLERFGLCHADDTGMLITNAANAKVNGIPYDIDADVRRCKEHWRRMGLDPATMQRIGEQNPITNFELTLQDGRVAVIYGDETNPSTR